MSQVVKDSAAGRNRLQVDERRAQLIALGLEMFADATYEEMSIGAIAKAAGISKGLLYHYFPSKRAFFAAAVREAARQLLAETDGAPPAHPDPDELRCRIDRYLAFVEKRPAAYAFLLRGQRGGADDVRAIVNETRQAFVDRILAGIAASLGGQPPSDRLRIAVRGWVGFVEAASLEWLERKTVPREELARMLASVCIATVELAVGRPLRGDREGGRPGQPAR